MRMQLSYGGSQHVDVRVLAATGQAGSLTIRSDADNG